MDRTASTASRGGYSAEIVGDHPRRGPRPADDWGGLGFGQGWACAPRPPARDRRPDREGAQRAGPLPRRRARRAPTWPATSATASSGSTERAADLRDAQPAWIRELVAGYVAGYNRRVAEAARRRRSPEWCAEARRGSGRSTSSTSTPTWSTSRSWPAAATWSSSSAGPRRPGPDGPVPRRRRWRRSALRPAASNGWAIGRRRDGVGSRHGAGQPPLPLVRRGPVLGVPPDASPAARRATACRCSASPACRSASTPASAGPTRSPRAPLHPLPARPRARRPDPLPLRRRRCARWSPPTHTVEVRRRRRRRRRRRSSGRCGAATTARCSTCRCWAGATRWASPTATPTSTTPRCVEQFLAHGPGHRPRRVPPGLRTRSKGMPWVNTLAADAAGRRLVHRRLGHPAPDRRGPAAVHAPASARTSIAALLFENRIALLDGSDPDDEWLDAPGRPLARASSRPRRLPELERPRRTCVNANDSHWLVAPRRGRSRATRCCAGSSARPARCAPARTCAWAPALAARGGVTLDDLLDAVCDDAVPERRAAASTTSSSGAGAPARSRWRATRPTWTGSPTSWRRGTAGSTSTRRGAVLWREFMVGLRRRGRGPTPGRCSPCRSIPTTPWPRRARWRRPAAHGRRPGAPRHRATRSRVLDAAGIVDSTRRSATCSGPPGATCGCRCTAAARARAC